MIQVPKWKSNFRIETMKPDLVIALSEEGHYVLKGESYYQVAPFIDGARKISEIADKTTDLPFMQVYYTINRLQNRGFVVDAATHLPAEIENLCHVLNIPPQDASKRFHNTKVHVMGVDSSLAPVLQEALAANQVHLTDSAHQSDLCLVVTSDYLHPEIENIHRRFSQSGQAWMLIKPDSISPWIGPLFDAQLSKCWACLEQRLRLHRRLEKTISMQPNHASFVYIPPALQSPAVTGLVVNLAATEILKWLLKGKNEDIEDHVIVLHTKTLEFEKHRFVKRPQCPVCGDAEIVKRRTLRPIELRSQPKRFTEDGGHRTVTPKQTVEKYKHHVSRITGVVSGLRKRETAGEGEDLLHTYLSGVNLKFNSPTYEGLRSLYRGGDGGKGASDVQSQASAICEAIERYSGSRHGDECVIYATYEELADQAVHPYKCLNFSEAQYENNTAINRVTKTSTYNRVRPRFSETEKMAWTPVWSLTEQKTKYLPTAFLYFGSISDVVSATPACSNGLAAGNTLEEAILQGFMELVERDSVGIWWYNRLRRPAVDLQTFPNPYIQKLLDYYRAIGRELWALDVTSDLGIPTFAAISRDVAGPREDLIFGFGAHFDPQIALLRALTEANQGVSAFLQANGEIPDFNEEGTDWWTNTTLENQPYMAPDPDLVPRRLEDFPEQWHDDLREDVQLCVAIAARNGMETLVIDQTQPDVGLNVVKVVVPGLRHFWRRLAPGRLYDVPVKMGWLERPLHEDELNPYSIFI